MSHDLLVMSHVFQLSETFCLIDITLEDKPCHGTRTRKSTSRIRESRAETRQPEMSTNVGDIKRSAKKDHSVEPCIRRRIEENIAFAIWAIWVTAAHRVFPTAQKSAGWRAFGPLCPPHGMPARHLCRANANSRRARNLRSHCRP